MSLLSDLKGFTSEIKSHRARIDALIVEAKKQAAFWQYKGAELAASARRTNLAMDRMKGWLST